MGSQRTPMKPLAPVLSLMSTMTLLPLLESTSRFAMTAECGRSSWYSSTRTSVTIVRVLPRAVAVERTQRRWLLFAS
jgi:hypothetical protein